MQKIDKINQLIDMQSSSEMSKAGEKGCADSDKYAGVTFANFKTLSQESCQEIVSAESNAYFGSLRRFGYAVTCDQEHD